MEPKGQRDKQILQGTHGELNSPTWVGGGTGSPSRFLQGQRTTRARKLLAHVDPLREAALLAQHIAAPVEPAVAALAVRLFQDVVSAAAAQRAAAVCAEAGLVAYPSLRPCRVHG